MAGVTLDVAAPGVLENDVLLDPNETVTLEVIADPTGGTLTLNDDGSFTYVPNAGFIGVDTFEYQLTSTLPSKLLGEFSDTAVVTITVTARTDLPAADPQIVDPDFLVVSAPGSGALFLSGGYHLLPRKTTHPCLGRDWKHNRLFV